MSRRQLSFNIRCSVVKGKWRLAYDTGDLTACRFNFPFYVSTSVHLRCLRAAQSELMFHFGDSIKPKWRVEIGRGHLGACRRLKANWKIYRHSRLGHLCRRMKERGREVPDVEIGPCLSRFIGINT